MQAPKFHQSRLDFQLERFLFFSDAVIAIIITLMVLEIKVPLNVTVNGVTHEIQNDSVLKNELAKLTMKFVGYLISFGIVGHYWSVHHRIFGYVIKYDSKLVWLNMGFLFCVALLPFSSNLLGEYSMEGRMHMHLPYLFYVINVCMVAAFNLAMWTYVSSPKREFLTHKISPIRIRLGVYRSLILPGVFVLSYLISFLWPWVARFFPLSIPLIVHYGMKGVEKKMLSYEDKIEKALEEAKNEKSESILA